MSILTLAEYRALTGDLSVADSTLQSALDGYSAIIESYCNKTWGAFSVTQTFTRPSNTPLFLVRDNISAVTAISINGEDLSVDDFTIDLANGLLHVDNTYLGASTVVVTLSVDRDAPDDVKHVQLALVKGYLAGTSGGESALRPVSKETVFGVSSTNYAIAALNGETHPELGGFTVLLDRYCDPVLA